MGLKATVTINQLGTELYIEFLEATGVYHVTDNPGGFGGSNAARNTLAIILYAVHKKVLGDVVASVVLNDPFSVSSFTVVIDKTVNGTLEYSLFALPIFDDLLTYEDGNIVYDAITDPMSPIIKEMVDGLWVAVTADELIGNEDVIQTTDYAFPIPQAIALANLLNAAKMLKLRRYIHKRCSKEEFHDLRIKFEYVEGLIKVATLAFCKQAYNEAQIDIEEVFNYESIALIGNE